MEHKVMAAADLKFTEESPHGEFSGYASTFSNWDMVKERPAKGAFTPHLDAFLKDGFIALGHDWNSLPIATPTDAYEDDHGLFIRAAFHSTQAAQDARKVLQERLALGKSAKTSIGYSVIADEYVEEGRVLKEIKLHEVSIVNVPANPLAAILSSKSGAVSDLGFNEHGEAVVSIVKAYMGRAQDRAKFRTDVKEGRIFSTANVRVFEGMRSSIAELDTTLAGFIEMGAPKAEPKSFNDEAKQVLIEWLRLEASLNGV
jgi:HK97 family phage prohead protease